MKGLRGCFCFISHISAGDLTIEDIDGGRSFPEGISEMVRDLCNARE